MVGDKASQTPTHSPYPGPIPQWIPAPSNISP